MRDKSTANMVLLKLLGSVNLSPKEKYTFADLKAIRLRRINNSKMGKDRTCIQHLKSTS